MPASTASRPETRGRATLYRGVRMRSRLEADFAGSLDASGAAWEYEPECYASGAVQWLPDFRVTPGDKTVLIEVKPTSLAFPAEPRADYGPTADHVDAILRRMAVAWDSEPSAWLNLEFWTYREGTSLRVLGRNGHPWIAWATDYPVLWQGMGQAERPDVGPHHWPALGSPADAGPHQGCWACSRPGGTLRGKKVSASWPPLLSPSRGPS